MIEEAILKHLKALVAADSQNPPRHFGPDDALIAYPKKVLASAGFRVEMQDFGEGHINLWAVRGQPKLLFNCHLDTVPVGEGWTHPPLELTRVEDKVYGRGVCDIKGAAAVLLALAEHSDDDLAILLTTDEEGAGSCCVKKFLHDHQGMYDHVVVCEPTQCQAITQHRGFLSVKGVISGVAGHSSELRALDDNANHRLAQWLSAALTYTRALAQSGQASCFNVGLMSGGTKSNVIAGEARLHYSARLGPGQSNEALFETLKNLGGAQEWAKWEIPFSGSPLPASGQSDEKIRAFCERVGARVELSMGEPVDFWTEASLFSEAGYPVLVLGPGDIAQAHTADEWVRVDQLMQAYACYGAMVKEAAAHV